eukprot:Polyplicarium_translucidae@DN3228_c0_g1_i4.p1
MLYAGVASTLRGHYATVGEEMARVPDENLLEALDLVWEDKRTTLKLVEDVLMYMNRNYCEATGKKLVWQLGLDSFCSEVVERDGVGNRVEQALLDSIAAERRGAQVDGLGQKNSIQMLVQLAQSRSGGGGQRDEHTGSVYSRFFESRFLEHTADFYTKEADLYIADQTISTYISKAAERIEEEDARVEKYLTPATRTPLMEIMEEQWVRKHTTVLLSNQGLKGIFRDDNHEDMSRMRALFSMSQDMQATLLTAFRETIVTAGEGILDDPRLINNPGGLIEMICDLKIKSVGFVEKSFARGGEFRKCVAQSLKDIINRNTRVARSLSLYLDDLLKRRAQAMNEDELHRKLDLALQIFPLVSDKDVFESFYGQHLSKRLLMQRSASDEAEKAVMTRLKAECGHLYTLKLEGMFRDLERSESMSRDFHADDSRRRPEFDLRVTVLTYTCWPTETHIPCEMPAAVAAECNAYREFYLGIHIGRRLTWQFSQGTAEVRALLSRGRHELLCSTFQTFILLLFNSAEVLTFSMIRDALDIPSEELKRQLVSLTAASRTRILTRNQSVGSVTSMKDIHADDTFQVNRDFDNKLYRIRLPQVAAVSKGEASGGDKDTIGLDVPASVEEDRKQLVEACVVRIMKSRKQLSHVELLAEVARHLQDRFQPAPSLIRQRVDHLISRDYIERHPSDRKIYKYLA